jgi:hypothetical protein
VDIACLRNLGRVPKDKTAFTKHTHLCNRKDIQDCSFVLDNHRKEVGQLKFLLELLSSILV